MNYSANKMAAKHCLSAQCIVVDNASLTYAVRQHCICEKQTFFDVSQDFLVLAIIYIYIYHKNIFHKKCSRASQASGDFLFLPHMTLYCVSVNKQKTGKCNLFVLYNKIEKIAELNR